MTTTDPSPEQILADALESRNAASAELIRDGRRLRAERGRMAVVQATFDLIQEAANPTIAEVADRAGISERTVFRYFADRDSLLAAVAAEVFPLVQPMLVVERPDADFSTRLRRLLELRIKLLRIGGAFARSVENNAPHSALAKDLVALRMETLRAQVVDFLEPELSEAGSFALPLIDTLLSHRSVFDLSAEMDDDAILAALETGITRILGR